MSFEEIQEARGLQLEDIRAGLGCSALTVHEECVSALEKPAERRVLKFLIDENMPRSSAELLRRSGYDAVNVRNIGMTGQVHYILTFTLKLKIRRELS
ncbi:MAG: DUF5615 family PIN-like protein [bacterium]